MPYPCAICGRVGRGFAFSGPRAPIVDFCSLECSEVYMVNRSRNIPVAREEARALQAGGNVGGAYLESIGKTDLADLTPEQWAEFLSRVLAGYSDDLIQQAREAVPF